MTMSTSAKPPIRQDETCEHIAKPRPVRRGDIRRVHVLVGLDGPSRLALIVRAPSGRDHAEIMLVHDRVEMAGQDDVVIHPESTELPDHLVVQTRLRGIVWNLQFSTLMGRLSSSEMASVARAATSINQDTDEGQSELTPEQDHARTDFHESELDALWALTGDYTDAALDDGEPWRIDTGLLSVECLDLHDDPAIILTEVMHILRTRPVAATIEDLGDLYASGATADSTWRSTTYGSGLASQIALSVKLLVESSLICSSDEDDQAYPLLNPTLLPKRSFPATSLTILPNERLVTAPFLWTDNGARLLRSPSDDDPQSDQSLEVMMLATSESKDSELETWSNHD